MPYSPCKPQWSPDGKWIVFLGLDSTNEEGLYGVYLDSALAEKLTNNSNATSACPIWSPDGTYLVYGLLQNNDGDTELYRFDPNTRRVQRITENIEQDRLVGWAAVPERKIAEQPFIFGGLVILLAGIGLWMKSKSPR